MVGEPVSASADPRERGGRDRVVAVRLRPAEADAWKEAAALAGRPQVAAWVRDVVGHALAGTRMPAAAEVDQLHALTGELGRVGSNLNQAVKALNALAAAGAVEPARAARAAAEVAQAADEVTKTLREAWQAIDGISS